MKHPVTKTVHGHEKFDFIFRFDDLLLDHWEFCLL
jgi:hypothetical protein